MNYLWQLLLYLYEQKIDLKTMRFLPAESYSPYMELSQKDINNTELKAGQEIEVNPYYRFYDIFIDLFPPELDEYKELRLALFQLIMHLLANNDLKQGMNRGEYYKKLLYTDMMQGTFGAQLTCGMELFSVKERNIILNGMIKQYQTGTTLTLFQSVVTALFHNTIIYSNTGRKNEILIYIGKRKTKLLEMKVQTVFQLFADIKYDIVLYYHYHFAILGIHDTCTIEEIALY